MDRRKFLTGLAVGSGAVLVGAPLLGGCGAATVRPTAGLGNTEADELRARLERGLGAVRGIAPGRIARELSAHPQPQLAEDVLRLGLEAFVVADVARSIPDGVHVPDRLAQRLAPELHVVDTYTQTYHALLCGMKTPARRRLDATMRAQPHVGMDVAGWIDGHAAELGVAGESRLKLRTAAVDATTRIRRQSSSAVIDDCVAKVQSVADRSGAQLALSRSIVSAAMIDAIWQQVQQGGVPPAPPPQGGGGAVLGNPEPEGGGGRILGGGAAPGTMESQRTYRDGRRWNDSWDRPGDEELEIGAIMMPFGLLTCGLLLIVGLVVVIAGAVQNGEWNGESEEARGQREGA